VSAAAWARSTAIVVLPSPETALVTRSVLIGRSLASSIVVRRMRNGSSSALRLRASVPGVPAGIVPRSGSPYSASISSAVPTRRSNDSTRKAMRKASAKPINNETRATTGTEAPEAVAGGVAELMIWVPALATARSGASLRMEALIVARWLDPAGERSYCF
jgi:hypothetical protein